MSLLFVQGHLDDLILKCRCTACSAVLKFWLLYVFVRAVCVTVYRCNSFQHYCCWHIKFCSIENLVSNFVFISDCWNLTLNPRCSRVSGYYTFLKGWTSFPWTVNTHMPVKSLHHYMNNNTSTFANLCCWGLSTVSVLTFERTERTRETKMEEVIMTLPTSHYIFTTQSYPSFFLPLFLPFLCQQRLSCANV